jgi:hypothetical protein
MVNLTNVHLIPIIGFVTESIFVLKTIIRFATPGG